MRSRLYGYCRVSTKKQDLARQLDALAAAGVETANLFTDKKSGSTRDRPGLEALLGVVRAGDVVVVHTLDRLGRTVRDTLIIVHELAEKGVGLRTLADPIVIDSSKPDDPMAQLAMVLLALFGQMERTYALERAAQARAAAAARGRPTGRPSIVTAETLELAVLLRGAGKTTAEVSRRTGVSHTTRYRHLAATSGNDPQGPRPWSER